jgi:hypothetical protein
MFEGFRDMKSFVGSDELDDDQTTQKIWVLLRFGPCDG